MSSTEKRTSVRKTDAAASTRISALRERVEALPGRRKSVGHVAKLKQLATVAAGTASRRKEMIVQYRCVKQTFPEAVVVEVEDSLERVRVLADALLGQLTERSSIDSDSLSNRFDSIVKGIAKGSAAVEASWKAQVSTVVERYQTVVEVARRTNPDAVAQMSAVLEKMKGIAKPSCNVRPSFGTLRDELMRLVVKLDLTGPGGEFLARVLAGSADTKDLLKPEVQKFLDEHKFWSLLSIRFVK